MFEMLAGLLQRKIAGYICLERTSYTLEILPGPLADQNPFKDSFRTAAVFQREEFTQSFFRAGAKACWRATQRSLPQASPATLLCSQQDNSSLLKICSFLIYKDTCLSSSHLQP